MRGGYPGFGALVAGGSIGWGKFAAVDMMKSAAFAMGSYGPVARAGLAVLDGFQGGAATDATDGALCFGLPVGGMVPGGGLGLCRQ